MPADLYLIAAPNAAPDDLLGRLDAARAGGTVSALLLPRGNRTDAAYAAFVRAIAPAAQAKGTAVVIEGAPAEVKTLGADGLHLSGDAGEVRAALAALKPHYIVGTGNIRSRHDAMTRAELGIDYILFGPLSGSIGEPERELARWWAETMEVPGVLSDPESSLADFDAEGCEFIGLAADRVAI